MHYDFKLKLNKIDSQQYPNLLIPEIDWILNEAQELFVKAVAKPRLRSHLGFELNQRVIDDIRTIVVNPDGDLSAALNVVDNSVALPNDYWHYLRAYVLVSKDKCTDKKARVFIRQHDDEFEESPFDASSFEWRSVNGVFYENGVKFYTDGSFTISKLCMSYIRRLSYIHNAEDYVRGNGVYNSPSGQVRSGSVNCELPEHTHREIIDIAVLIATGQIQVPDFNLRMAKLNFNKIN